MKFNTDVIFDERREQEQQETPKKPVVVFCIPGKDFSQGFFNSWTKFLYFLNLKPIIDIHIVNSKDLFYHMLYFGYGENFSRIMRQKAKKLGYKLNNKGLFKNGKKIKLFKEV